MICHQHRACKRQIARNNPVCERVSFAGHLVRVSVGRSGPPQPHAPEKARAASANTVRRQCQPG
jgi:hypothetical protein